MALTQVQGGMILPSTTLTTPIVATTMGVGGATPAASGSGITFPATQSASSDANTLDDYEEGTWSPTIIGTTTAGTVSYNSRQGRYTKIGNIVTISAWVDWSSGTGSGLLRISGLPFTGSTNQYQAIGLGGVAALATGGSGKIPFLRLPTGESSIQVKTMYWDGSSFSDDDVSYDASAVITLTGTYIIA